MGKRKREDHGEYLVGNRGKEYIRESLSRTNPKTAIADFQKKQCVKVPHCDALVSLLELMGLRRTEVFSHVVEVLRTKTLEKVSNTDDKQTLLSLLDECFPCIDVPELRPIPLAVLEKLPKVPKRFLRRFCEEPALMEPSIPLCVRRQLLEVDDQRFEEGFRPLLHSYAKTPGIRASMLDMLGTRMQHSAAAGTAADASLKRRQENTALQEIISLIGGDASLFKKLLRFLRKEYGRSGEKSLCVLRSDVVLAAREATCEAMCMEDPWYRLCWCVEACVREGLVSRKHLQEMQVIMDSMEKRGDVEVTWADAGMIVAHPVFVHAMLKTAYTLIKEVVENERVPKDDQDLCFLIRLLYLGSEAVSMIREHRNEFFVVPATILSSFVPLLAAMVLDDILREDDFASENPEPYNASLSTFWATSTVARMLLQYYTLLRVRLGDLLALQGLLPMVMAGGTHTMSKPFVHSFVDVLISKKDALTGQFWSATITHFLTPLALKWGYVLQETLRLLSAVTAARVPRGTPSTGGVVVGKPKAGDLAGLQSVVATLRKVLPVTEPRGDTSAKVEDSKTTVESAPDTDAAAVKTAEAAAVKTVEAAATPSSEAAATGEASSLTQDTTARALASTAAPSTHKKISTSSRLHVEAIYQRLRSLFASEGADPASTIAVKRFITDADLAYLQKYVG